MVPPQPDPVQTGSFSLDDGNIVRTSLSISYDELLTLHSSAWGWTSRTQRWAQQTSSRISISTPSSTKTPVITTTSALIPRHSWKAAKSVRNELERRSRLLVAFSQAFSSIPSSAFLSVYHCPHPVSSHQLFVSRKRSLGGSSLGVLERPKSWLLISVYRHICHVFVEIWIIVIVKANVSGPQLLGSPLFFCYDFCKRNPREKFSSTNTCFLDSK